MWTNPLLTDGKQPVQPLAEPPQESGIRVAAFPRPNRKGPHEELRVHLASFEGHPYISVRLWTQDSRSGSWWPTKKGVSVRLAEVDGVAQALQDALALSESGEADNQHDQAPARNQRQGNQSRTPAKQTSTTSRPTTNDDFDEFA